VNAACYEFRARLASVLAGRVEPATLLQPAALAELAWHEHLLACGDCRELLEAEEALDQLLASLPDPKLPRALAERVLSRLEVSRLAEPLEAALDALLERSDVAEAPGQLAARVLANLEDERRTARVEHELDRLLERVDAPRTPVGLAARMLARLDGERARPMVAAQPRRSRRVSMYALAASLVIALGVAAWLRWVHEPTAPSDRNVASTETAAPSVAPSANEPPQELLASLELLESWDLVTDDSLDARLNALDSFDEMLLSIDADSSAASGETRDDPATPPAQQQPPSKG
jgi:hypothetical protein